MKQGEKRPVYCSHVRTERHVPMVILENVNRGTMIKCTVCNTIWSTSELQPLVEIGYIIV
jgi:hypothetical protein